MTKQEFYQEDFIEQYLQGTLPTPQKEAFEAALAQDSKLQELFSWQKEILEAIREARHAELKARLKALPTPRLSLWQQPATWIKVTGVSVILLLITALLLRSQLPIGSFFESELPLRTEKAQENTQAETQNSLAIAEDNLPEPQALENKNQSGTENQNSTIQATNSVPKDKETKSETSIIDAQQGALPKEEKELLQEDKSNFQFEVYYQYHDNVLQLFENIPYQLIKADLGEGEKAYLYTKESFFELRQSSSEIFNLKDTRISNPSHIEKLQALKK